MVTIHLYKLNSFTSLSILSILHMRPINHQYTLLLNNMTGVTQCHLIWVKCLVGLLRIANWSTEISSHWMLLYKMQFYFLFLWSLVWLDIILNKGTVLLICFQNLNNTGFCQNVLRNIVSSSFPASTGPIWIQNKFTT